MYQSYNIMLTDCLIQTAINPLTPRSDSHIRCNFSLQFKYIILKTSYENRQADQLKLGCYLDKTPNYPVQFTRECKAASQENY